MFGFLSYDYRSFFLPLAFLFAVSLGMGAKCQTLGKEKIYFIYHCVYPFLYKAEGETKIKEGALLKIWDALKTDSSSVDSALLLEVYELKNFEKVWPPSKLAQYSPEQTAYDEGQGEHPESHRCLQKASNPLLARRLPSDGTRPSIPIHLRLFINPQGSSAGE
jgi:hypothetical protein